jgi:hypothetical protein
VGSGEELDVAVLLVDELPVVDWPDVEEDVDDVVPAEAVEDEEDETPVPSNVEEEEETPVPRMLELEDETPVPRKLELEDDEDTPVPRDTDVMDDEVVETPLKDTVDTPVLRGTDTVEDVAELRLLRDVNDDVEEDDDTLVPSSTEKDDVLARIAVEEVLVYKPLEAPVESKTDAEAAGANRQSNESKDAIAEITKVRNQRVMMMTKAKLTYYSAREIDI